MNDLLDFDEPDEKPTKVWIPYGPEDRLSIALYRLLDDTLERPCYFVMNHDADRGARNDRQRDRDSNKGIKSGQLDVEVEQGPVHRFRRIELKRGKNRPTELQKQTIKTCTACGAPPIVAWTLDEAIRGLVREGFRFMAHVGTRLIYWQEQLAGWDREAEAKLAGTSAPKKKRSGAGKAVPRFGGTVKQAHKRGAWKL